MTCSNEVYNAPMTLPARTQSWKRSAFLTAMILTIEAFQEALAMRRTAQKTYLLNDE
jgi:hypothetical protein